MGNDGCKAEEIQEPRYSSARTPKVILRYHAEQVKKEDPPPHLQPSQSSTLVYHSVESEDVIESWL
jgi:hypothetical protein